MARSTKLFSTVICILGCAGSARTPGALHSQANPQSPSPTPHATGSTPIVTASTRLTSLALTERPELREDLAAERVTGTIALFDSAEGKLLCSDAARCKLPHLPASTFKIANSIVALETGTVSDPETVLKWDGKTRPVASWNEDMSLRKAVQVSCVPCFQDIARKVGEGPMRDWLKRLDYGNQDISGGIDRFWLWGGLRISAIGQLDFLRRLDLAVLPIQGSTREMVIDLITLDVSDEHVLRGKTGSALKPQEPETIGWFVGWVERSERRIYFATALDGFESDVDFMTVRRRVTERVLRRLGALP